MVELSKNVMNDSLKCYKCLTVNKEKCEFNMSQLNYIEHVLSARGIGPAKIKIEAVVNACEPQNASKVNLKSCDL